jgi:hypothetical protein
MMAPGSEISLLESGGRSANATVPEETTVIQNVATPAAGTPSGSEGVSPALPFGVQVSVLPFNERSTLTEFAPVKTPPAASTMNGAAGVR